MKNNYVTKIEVPLKHGVKAIFTMGYNTSHYVLVDAAGKTSKQSELFESKEKAVLTAELYNMQVLK